VRDNACKNNELKFKKMVYNNKKGKQFSESIIFYSTKLKKIFKKKKKKKLQRFFMPTELKLLTKFVSCQLGTTSINSHVINHYP
jgi:hypothetical protein